MSEIHSPSRLTIGIPLFNAEDTIAETIISLKAQSLKSFFVLISDNCSTDRSVDKAIEAISGDTRFRLLKQPRRIRSYENFQFLLDNCSSEYFGWLAADDMISENYYEALVRNLDSDEELVLSCASVTAFQQQDSDREYLWTLSYGGYRTDHRNTFDNLTRRLFAYPSYNHFYGIYRYRLIKYFQFSKFRTFFQGEEPFLAFVAGRGVVKGDAIPTFYRRYQSDGSASHEKWLPKEALFRDRALHRVRLLVLCLADARSHAFAKSSTGPKRFFLSCYFFALLYLPLKTRQIRAKLTRMRGTSLIIKKQY